jgi:pimeloyl-ACP methyl ester carboxylesterase
MDKRFTFQDSEGRRISAVLSSPPAPTDKIVILCHGFLGSKDSWTNRTLSERLATHQIATLRFDFFAHGQSGGELKDLLLTTLVAQTQSVMALMRGHGFAHIALLGSSFGGLVATLVAAKHPTLKALALRCPVSDFPALLRQQFGNAAIELWRRLGQVPSSVAPIPVHYRFLEDCERHDVRQAAQALRMPTIIVHGDRDEVIPLSQSEELYGQVRAEKALHIIPGADHRFSSPEHFTHVSELLVGWLTRYLSTGVAAAS